MKESVPVDASQEERGQSPLPFFVIYLVAGIGWFLVQKGGLYTILAPLGITFVAVPLFDVIMGIDARNPPPGPRGASAKAAFRLATWLAVPVQTALLFWGASVVTRASASSIRFVEVAVAVGITGGAIGITVAHELIHRSSRVDRALGGLLLVMVCYLHWAIEHVAGHHQRVATPDDPATARLGEILPAFLLRSTAFGFLSAWRIEGHRNARRGIQSPLRNGVLGCVLASCALAAVLGIAFGPRAVWFFVAQSAIAVAFLETINYVEHYGLERRLLRPGAYERVSTLHSWNSSYRLTNALLFNLQRHSDHHVWPARPYYMLRQDPESPQLPLGYAGMALLAMVPPLFHRVMDPRVEAHRARLAGVASEPSGESRSGLSS